MMTAADRRSAEEVVLPVYLVEERRFVEVADGEVVGLGFTPYLDPSHTLALIEDDEAPVLPGVFFAQVVGVSFHDDVLQLPQFGAGRTLEIRHEPDNPTDRNALAVFGGGQRVGYIPTPIASLLAPAGTRAGRGLVVTEWSTNGVRRGISVLGSMHVNLAVAGPAATVPGDG